MFTSVHRVQHCYMQKKEDRNKNGTEHVILSTEQYKHGQTRLEEAKEIFGTITCV